MIKIFSIPNCVPCLQTKTYLHAHGVEFEEIDATEDPEQALAYRVSAAPTIIILNEAGEVVDRFSGYSKERLAKLIEGA